MKHTTRYQTPVVAPKAEQRHGKRQIALYVTPAEAEMIEQIAKMLGKSNSAFVKQAVVLHLRDILAQADAENE